MKKFLLISDTHNKHLKIPKEYIENADNSIDTIIHAGDMSGRGYLNEIEPFLDWYNNLNFTNKILIAGNHDFYFEHGTSPHLPGHPDDVPNLLAKYPNITYLNDSGIEIDGIKFWGSPIQPWFYSWAFNRKGSDICKHWNMIPLDTNVLIVHGPAKGYLDMVIDGESVGCPYLLGKIAELKDLSLFVCGHIHEAYGHIQFADGATFVNASVLNHRYEMTNKPYILTIDEVTKKVISIEKPNRII